MYIGQILFLQLLILGSVKVCEFHKTLNNNENCYCFQNPDNLPLVSEILKKTYSTTQRLVVYFYQNVDTRQISMFIPNSVKQKRIPELPLDANDDLIYPSPSETIYHAVNTSPHKIIIYTTSNEPKAIDTTKDKTTIIEEVIVADPFNWNSAKVNVNRPSMDIISPVNVIYDQETVKKSVITVDNKNNNKQVETSQMVKPVKRVIISDDSYTGDQVIETTINIPGQQYVLPSHNQQINNQEIIISGGNHVIVKPDLVTKSNYSLHKHNVDKSVINKWIEQQIIKIGGDITSKDSESLRILIIKALTENKITVTEDGYLIDAWGTKLDPFNLVITPVLLGGSAGYNGLLQNVFKTLIISLKNPPRVLGVIPLGKTHHASAHFLKHIKKHPKMKKTICHRCAAIAYARRPSLVSSGFNYGMFPHQQTIYRRRKMIPENTLNEDLNNPLPFKTIYNAEEPGNSELSADDKVDDNEKQRGNFKLPMIDSVLGMFNKFIPPSVQNDALEGKTEGEGKGSKEEDEGVGIRIVGGSAATGSGTPVSSKGRSRKKMENDEYLM